MGGMDIFGENPEETKKKNKEIESGLLGCFEHKLYRMHSHIYYVKAFISQCYMFGIDPLPKIQEALSKNETTKNFVLKYTEKYKEYKEGKLAFGSNGDPTIWVIHDTKTHDVEFYIM